MSEPRISLDPGREPWDRQPRESAKQHARLLYFRDLGRARTLKTTAQTLNDLGDQVTHRTLQQLAYTYRWTERVEAWDLEQDRLDRERLVIERHDMVDRHRKVASGLLAKAITALGKVNPEVLDPQDIVRMVKLATDLERNALSLPARTVEVTGPAGGPIQTEDLTGLTGEERRARLAELAAELARRAGPLGDDDD